MGRGGRGGGRYTPNDDRSRSMNPQDVCGQAAAANEARQRGDDGDWGDDDGESYPTDFSEIITQQLEKARKPLPIVERLIPPTGEVASIVYSYVDHEYVLTVSDNRNFIMFVPDVEYFKRLLVGLGYTVEVEWRKL